jgi:hypothetical protein
LKECIVKLKTLIAGTAFTVLCGAVLAQGAAPSPGATPGVDQRQANQERRIDQGVASGQLTPREARRMQRQQAGVERAEARAKADGTVTARERQRLHQRQDRTSRHIYRQKHDAQRRAN